MVSVLWVLLLLSSLAATSLYVTRTHAILSHRGLEFAQAQAAADAAISDTFARLINSDDIRHREIGTPARAWTFDGIPVSIWVTREAGRLDLNTGDNLLLEAIIQSSGIGAVRSQQMIKELRDTQDPGLFAENRVVGDAAMNLSSGVRSLSRAVRLQSVDEIRRFPAWGSENISCLMDSFTVYTGLKGIHATDAGSTIKAALKFAQERNLNVQDWVTTQESQTSAVGERTVFGEVLRIRALARNSNQAIVDLQWVGRITGDPASPILTLHWGTKIAQSDCGDRH